MLNIETSFTPPMENFTPFMYHMAFYWLKYASFELHKEFNIGNA